MRCTMCFSRWHFTRVYLCAVRILYHTCYDVFCGLRGRTLSVCIFRIDCFCAYLQQYRLLSHYDVHASLLGRHLRVASDQSHSMLITYCVDNQQCCCGSREAQTFPEARRNALIFEHCNGHSAAASCCAFRDNR